VKCQTSNLFLLVSLFFLPFTEPAVKPAAVRTESQHVGVIATRSTFQGELLAQLMERFAHGATVHTQVCPGLVRRFVDIPGPVHGVCWDGEA
jgi:glutamate racemase